MLPWSCQKHFQMDVDRLLLVSPGGRRFICLILLQSLKLSWDIYQLMVQVSNSFKFIWIHFVFFHELDYLVQKLMALELRPKS